MPVLLSVYAGLVLRRLVSAAGTGSTEDAFGGRPLRKPRAPRHLPARALREAPSVRTSTRRAAHADLSPLRDRLQAAGTALRAHLIALDPGALPARLPTLALAVRNATPMLRPALVVAVGVLLTTATYSAVPEPLQANPASLAAAAPTPPPRAIARVGPAVISGHGLLDTLRFDFTSPMDASTVQAALVVEPAAPILLAWSSGGRSLEVGPAEAWRPGTAYRMRIGAGARDLLGLPLAAPVEASFQTRPSAAARLVVPTGASAALVGMVELRFSRPVRIASVPGALRIAPRTTGTISALGATGRGLGTRFSWRPAAPLRPGTRYTFTLAGPIVDEDGVRVAAAARATLRTPGRPGIVRHRPAARATGVARDALISVRFTERMDRRSTERAFSISGLAAASAGSFSWHEADTVLAYDPKSPLAAGRAYTVSIGASARSARGVAIRPGRAPALTFTFRVERAAPVLTSARVPRSPGSGGSTSAGWLAVERYVLGLVNCIRTGGTLQSDGDCVGYGSGRNGGYARPLTLHAGISARVARPYAKYLAVRAACSHFLDGNPGFRLRRSGYTSYRWAENLGCRSGNPYTAVLGSHLYFQSEKSYLGGHWVNLKNPVYSTVGIGVWVSNGNVRVVTNFYDP